MRLDFSFPPGVDPDDTSFTEIAGVASVNMMRVRRGQWQTVNGWEKIKTSALTGVCRGCFAWTDYTPRLNIAFGTHQKLQVYRGGSLYDITPVGLAEGRINGRGGAGYGSGTYGIGEYGQPSLADNYPRSWSFGAVGQALYACPRGQTIFEWGNDAGTPAAALSGAPERVEHLLALDSGQLVALGCTNEDDEFDPLCIRVSDPVDRTDWITGTSDNARQYVLAGGGRIIAGRVVGKFIIVWTDSAVYLGQFIGFPDGWVFDLVEHGRGLIGPMAAAVVAGAAYWMSPGRQFYRLYPGGPVEPLVCSAQSELADLPRSQQDKVVASSIADFNEIAWFYPGASLENDRALVLSLGEEGGPWVTHQLARTSFIDKGPSAHPVGVDYAGFFYYHEKGTSANGAAFAWSLRSKKQYIAKGQKRLFVSGCWPDFHDQVGPITLNFYVSDDPQGTAEVWGPFTLAPGETRVDFMFEGRLIEVEVSGNSAPTSARLGMLTFEVQPAGET